MATPSAGTTINRTELGATFHEFSTAMDRQGFIAPQVFRPRLVGTQKADAGKVPLKALLQARDTNRAPGTGYARSNFEFDKYSYETSEQGAEEVLDDRTLAMFRDLLDAETIHAERAIDAVLRKYEIQVAAALYDTAVWTGAALTTALTNEWDDASNATPIDDVEAARLKIIDGCGLVPNSLVVNRKQFFGLKNCDQIVDRVKYSGHTNPLDITPAAIAAALDLEQVLVAGGHKNTANEGQDASLSPIWSDEYAMLCRTATSDDPREPCLGRTFLWEGESAGVGTDEELAIIVEEYREEISRGSVIRARTDWDIVVMYVEAGHLLSNVTTI